MTRFLSADGDPSKEELIHITRRNRSRNVVTVSSGQYICTVSPLQIDCFTQGKLNSLALHAKRTPPWKNQDCSNNNVQKAHCFLLWSPGSYRLIDHLQKNPPVEPREVSSLRVGSEKRRHSQTLPRRLGPGAPSPHCPPSRPRSLPPYLSGSREI